MQQDQADVPGGDHHEERPVAEQPDHDIREVAADEPRPQAEDDVRVPSADETAAAVESAQRALAEIRAREIADAAAEEQHRADQLSHWHDHDQIAEAADSAADDADEPDLVDADQP